MPHVWHQDSAGKNNKAVQAIVVRFREDFLGADWLRQPEMEHLQRLFLRARRGLEIRGKTRTVVSELMLRLSKQQGLRRVITLLEVLDLLSHSTDLKALASAGFRPVLEATDQERMGRIMRFIQDHLTEELSRDELARVASLSAGAFSRYFKSRTGKTLPEYVNELRIGQACRMLSDSDVAVTDIAFDCGFRNLANFNRWFLKLTGLVPRDYRRRLLADL